jgi:uncharacterized membrane protein YdjX (TVP38/TMEM64 family)
MKTTRRVIYFQIAGLLALVAGMFLVQCVGPIADWIALVQQRVMHWGAWSAICYPLLYACCNVLLLPGGILNIGGGFFFGLWWGFLIVLVGNVLGGALSFFLSRVVRRRWLGRRLRSHPTYKALEPAIQREAWKIILLSQLHPLFPTSLLNYLYGLTTIRFRTCMLWVAIGRAPGLFLYTYLGTLGQLGLNHFRDKTHPHVFEYVIWGAGLLSVILLVIVLGRSAHRLLSQAEGETRSRSQELQNLRPEAIANTN